MKYVITTIICFFFFQGFSQKNVSDYKYAIVPKKFDFQKRPDQYQLNQLTKFLLKKYGFDAYVEGEELPQDLLDNNCLALKAIVESSGALKTKTKVKFVDCFNNLIFTSDEAVSREKDYNKVYNITIREAFKSVESLNYIYIPKETKRQETTTNKVKELAKPKMETPKKEVIKEVVESKTESFDVAPEKSDNNPLDNFEKFTRDSQTFYLKPGYGGMYMVDGTNENVFKLQETSQKHVYILTINALTGVAFFDQERGTYTLEYFKNNERKIAIYRRAQ